MLANLARSIGGGRNSISSSLVHFITDILKVNSGLTLFRSILYLGLDLRYHSRYWSTPIKVISIQIDASKTVLVKRAIVVESTNKFQLDLTA